MANVIALVVIDAEHGFLSLPAALERPLAGKFVLHHTLSRVASIKQIARIVVVHPQGQGEAAETLLQQANCDKPVEPFAYEPSEDQGYATRWRKARCWAKASWRGGLGGSVVYDELLPAEPLAQAIAAHNADAAVVVRGEWCCVDPAYATGQLKIHLDAPQAMKIAFAQAPPGVSPLVTSRAVLEDMAENKAGFGQIFGYNPKAPMIDPIGREANLPIDASVRDCHHRLIADTPRSIDLLESIAQTLGERFADADAKLITDTATELTPPDDWPYRRLPDWVTMELTTARHVTGPITVQHHVDLPDAQMDLATTHSLLTELGDPATAGDVSLMLGHLGDAMLHPDWRTIARQAHDAGVLSVGLSTDLLCDSDEVLSILDEPIDLVVVQLNADNQQSYEKQMGADRFKHVTGNIQALINARNRRTRFESKPAGLPWIVPSLIKTHDTLADMDSFFDRWTTITGHALIAPAPTGCGLINDRSPVPMTPPKRVPCRQLGRRMTIAADGSLPLCDQDWLRKACLGDDGNGNDSDHGHGSAAQRAPLIERWRTQQAVLCDHLAGKFQPDALCGRCPQWHRP